MMRGLNVRVEMNGDVTPDAGNTIIRLLVVMIVLVKSSTQSTVTVTSVSTVSGSVTVQFRVCKVPSYSSPLGILSVEVAVGTIIMDRHKIVYTDSLTITYI